MHNSELGIDVRDVRKGCKDIVFFMDCNKITDLNSLNAFFGRMNAYRREEQSANGNIVIKTQQKSANQRVSFISYHNGSPSEDNEIVKVMIDAGKNYSVVFLTCHENFPDYFRLRPCLEDRPGRYKKDIAGASIESVRKELGQI